MSVLLLPKFILMLYAIKYVRIYRLYNDLLFSFFGFSYHTDELKNLWHFAKIHVLTLFIFL